MRAIAQKIRTFARNSLSHAGSTVVIFVLAWPLRAIPDTAEDTTSKTSFIPAEPSNRVDPVYPTKAEGVPDNGWVMVHFMVSRDGRAYEPTVMESMHPRFDAPALEAVLKTRYVPATFGGRAIDSGATQFLLISNGDKTRPTVNRNIYVWDRQMNRALLDREKHTARRLSHKIERYAARNLIESELKTMTLFRYAREYEDTNEQLRHLRKLLLFKRAGRREPGWTYKAVANDEFRVALELQDYELALQVWSRLEPTLTEMQRDAHLRVIESIESLRTSNKTIAIPARIGKRGSWFIGLFKERFALTDTDNGSWTVKLRCERGFAKLNIDQDRTYEVPDGVGRCQLEVLGEIDSAFTLLQL